MLITKIYCDMCRTEIARGEYDVISISKRTINTKRKQKDKYSIENIFENRFKTKVIFLY